MLHTAHHHHQKQNCDSVQRSQLVQKGNFYKQSLNFLNNSIIKWKFHKVANEALSNSEIQVFPSHYPEQPTYS